MIIESRSQNSGNEVHKGASRFSLYMGRAFYYVQQFDVGCCRTEQGDRVRARDLQNVGRMPLHSARQAACILLPCLQRSLSLYAA